MTMLRGLHLVVLTCLASVSTVLGQTRPREVLVQESFTSTAPISPSGSFTLSNPSGNVSIRGEGDSVRIDAIKRASGTSDQDARQELQAIGIEVTADQGSVTVQTTIAERPNPSAVDYTITVPAGVSITVRTTAGNLSVTSVNGAVVASTVSGDLHVSTLADLRVATTISGDLEIRDSLGDQISAGTLSGAVQIDGLTASSVDLNVGDGSITCTDVRASRAYVRTNRGDIDCMAALSRGGIYQLHSGSGNVRFVPQGNAGFRADAYSVQGQIRSMYEFPAGSVVVTSDGKYQTLQGTVGDGSASVTLRSLRGNVTLDRP